MPPDHADSAKLLCSISSEIKQNCQWIVWLELKSFCFIFRFNYVIWSFLFSNPRFIFVVLFPSYQSSSMMWLVSPYLPFTDMILSRSLVGQDRMQKSTLYANIWGWGCLLHFMPTSIWGWGCLLHFMPISGDEVVCFQMLHHCPIEDKIDHLELTIS